MNRTTFRIIFLVNVFGAAIVAGRAESQTSPTEDTSSTKRFPWLTFGFALGPGVNWRHSVDASPANQTNLGLVGGIFRGAKYGPGQRAGLIPAFKLYLRPMKTDAVDVLGPSAKVLETLKLRPIMAGLGWAQPFGKQLSGRITVVAGPSINSLGASEPARSTPQLTVPVSPSAISNGLAWESIGRLWYSVGARASIITGVSYLHVRPELTFPNEVTRSWNADQVHADLGIAFTLFQRR